MAKTVHELRNEIRNGVGRFEREVSGGFTKETLAVICDAVDYDIDANQLPAKAQMRAGILWKIGRLDDHNPEDADRSFRKTELEAIADAVGEE